MSTQKKESSTEKGQARNSTGQHASTENPAPKGKGRDGQRLPETSSRDPKMKGDSKRPTMNSKKH